MNQKPKKLMAFAFPTLKEDAWDFIQSVRKNNDPKGFAAIDPHFTLFNSSITFSKNSFSDVFRKKLKTQPRIEFSIRTALLMPPLNGHTSWYAFLVPDEGFSCLHKLHRLSYRDEFQNALDETFPFIPHITIGSFDNPKQCIQLVNEMNKQKFELSGQITKIHLTEDISNTVNIFDEIELTPKG